MPTTPPGLLPLTEDEVEEVEAFLIVDREGAAAMIRTRSKARASG